MGVYKNISIARDTMDIISKGEYVCKTGEKVVLPKVDYSKVEVFSPKQLVTIEEDVDGFFANRLQRSEETHFYAIDSDSLEAAINLPNALVMNFANAYQPGGGFLYGAVAQEEALCRNSTLYVSIAGREAKEMYDFNIKSRNPLVSDYMLISPNVCVFRNPEGKLLEHPYRTSVVTVPAPNRNGEARDLSVSEVNVCMMNRMRRMLFLAAYKGYRHMILGAWGCGAFGNDVKDLIDIYKHLFFDEGMDELFDTICFAVYKDPEKLSRFQAEFT